MTPDLTQLKKLAEAATPGPWKMAGTVDKPWPVISSHDHERGYQIHSMAHVKDIYPDVWPHMFEKYCRDAAYIAAVHPGVVLALLEDVARLREENERLKESRNRIISESAESFKALRRAWPALGRCIKREEALQDSLTAERQKGQALLEERQRLDSAIDGLGDWLQVASRRTDGGQHLHAHAVLEEMDALGLALPAESPTREEPVDAQALAWAVSNCYVLARRRLRVSVSSEQEWWKHILRICEKAGAQSTGVLRAAVPTEITEGAESPTPTQEGK